MVATCINQKDIFFFVFLGTEVNRAYTNILPQPQPEASWFQQKIRNIWICEGPDLIMCGGLDSTNGLQSANHGHNTEYQIGIKEMLSFW